MKRIVFLSLLIIFACNTENASIENLRNLNKEKQGNNDKQQDEIKYLKERLDSLEHKTKQNLIDSSQSMIYESNSTQYYFIVLDVVENQYNTIKNLIYTTPVTEITYYDDNIKYKLLDAFINQYKESIHGTLYEGRVKRRNIYLFNTYEDASKAREKYIMN